MTTIIEPCVLGPSRDSRVLEYHCFKESRALCDCASCGFNGSSIITRLPPRPVKVPPTEVASREPRAVVMTSVTIPAEHKDRLIQLGYIQELSGGLRLTNAGRLRIAEGK